MAKLPSFLWLEVDDVVSASLADIAARQGDQHPGHPVQGACRPPGGLIPRGLLRAAVQTSRGRPWPNLTATELAELVRQLSVVHGRVTLSSGKEADYYVDLRRATLHHRASALIGR